MYLNIYNPDDALHYINFLTLLLRFKDNTNLILVIKMTTIMHKLTCNYTIIESHDNLYSS